MEIDWQVLAAAIATFVGTGFLTIKGWLDKKRELKEEKHTLIGGVLQDNFTMMQNTEQVRQLCDEMEGLRSDIRLNTAALTRHADILLIRRR